QTIQRPSRWPEGRRMPVAEAAERVRGRGIPLAERIHAAVVLHADQRGVWEPERGALTIGKAVRMNRRSDEKARPSRPNYEFICDAIEAAVEAGWLTRESEPDRLEL